MSTKSAGDLELEEESLKEIDPYLEEADPEDVVIQARFEVSVSERHGGKNELPDDYKEIMGDAMAEIAYLMDYVKGTDLEYGIEDIVAALERAVEETDDFGTINTSDSTIIYYRDNPQTWIESDTAISPEDAT